MAQKVQLIAVGTLLLALAGACERTPLWRTPLAPSPPPSGPTTPPPSGPITLVVTGSVRDILGRLCEGCAVEVMDGPSAGMSVLTDVNGRFSLSISFSSTASSVTVQTSGNGYRPARQVTRGGFVSFTLESLQPLDLAGTYAITFEAAAQCTELPESTRKREYSVTLSARSQSVFVARPGAGTFDAFEMTWRVSDKEAQMIAADGDSGEIPGIVERLGSDETVRLYVFSRPGEITAAASTRLPVIGVFEHCMGRSVCSACQSQQHLLTMSRR
jgi:hypothetical protein